MFSKSKINEPAQKAPEVSKSVEPEKTTSAVPVAKPKPPASMLSQDLNSREHQDYRRYSSGGNG